MGAQLPKCCRLFFSSIPKQASLPTFNGPRATIKDALTALWEASDRVVRQVAQDDDADLAACP
ncbi:hypothetical protein IVB15_24110 [Bradyrhizobium sp. 182]|uniref:hypothetical protein n=1 Tax=unclassified Bradyrhizobium TaxID=2631580 RepID=UPI001FF89482|nr:MULTISPECIES: hypothetical protein [unclassified Bradyrhizobium]MCK1530726.1 hypothetical protein [Bradyrhizobium sp. 182]MCK1544705.1 hypothetical protein [Bradyrhizobium sp. 179]